MYKLTVDEAHTFFVGEGQWLVNNDSCPIEGEVQKNVTDGHNDALQEAAERLANSGQFDVVWRDTALSIATRGEVPSTRRPDVIDVNYNEKIAHMIEIPSPTQIYINRKLKTVKYESMFLAAIKVRESALQSKGWKVITEIVHPF